MLAGALALTTAAHAHIGSPDVYVETQAGPYKLFIVVRPPLVIPGVAEIEVRSESGGVEGITITPVPLTGEASLHPPVPDAMVRTSGDAQFFTGHLWIMSTGSWQIRFALTGDKGAAAVSIPLPATASTTRPMTAGLGVMLAVLGILLVLGMIGIVGAAMREARLAPGETVPRTNVRAGRMAMAGTFVLLIAALILGNMWWKAEAASYSEYVYKPLEMTAAVDGANRLDLQLKDPGWLVQRKLDDFVLDHNHLMHLYMIRWPEMDAVYHLHPDPVGSGEFQLEMPTVPAGTYRLFADVVHKSGFPETAAATINLPAVKGRALAGDDAEGTAPAVTPSTDASGTGDERFKLPDGYTMVWERSGVLKTKTPVSFQFALLDAQGKPARDMALYMGMLGHAAFVKDDGTAFAHIHPTGTVSMAAFMMANPQAGTASGGGMDGMQMPGMTMDAAAIPNVVAFPYGFPTAGSYRIIVQMKHGATVETGIFDAAARDAGK
jgi:hypothetical protein